MAVLFDTSALLLAMFPSAKPPADPATKHPVEHAHERITYRIERLSKARTPVLIPTPVLSEILVKGGAATQQYVAKLSTHPLQLVPFDTRAAVECADMLSKHGHKAGKAGASQGTRTKVKFDRQIIAIAKVLRVTAIYSDDADIHKYGTACGIKVVRTFELEPDPAANQKALDFTASGPNQDTDKQADGS